MQQATRQTNIDTFHNFTSAAANQREAMIRWGVELLILDYKLMNVVCNAIFSRFKRQPPHLKVFVGSHSKAAAVVVTKYTHTFARQLHFGGLLT